MRVSVPLAVCLNCHCNSHQSNIGMFWVSLSSQKWWKLLSAWQWIRDSCAFLEWFKHWKAIVIDLSFFRGLTNLSFPFVKTFLPSNQVKHIFLSSVSTFFGNHSDLVSSRREDCLLSAFPCSLNIFLYRFEK